MGTFETFDHTADVGFEVRGESFEDLLATAARAVFSLVLEDRPGAVETKAEIEVTHRGGLEDQAELFVLWLQELLYRFDTEHLVPLEFDFQEASPDRVRAQVGFSRFDPKRHRAGAEVKAVTYHGLEVHKDASGGWSARFILDV